MNKTLNSIVLSYSRGILRFFVANLLMTSATASLLNSSLLIARTPQIARALVRHCRALVRHCRTQVRLDAAQRTEGPLTTGTRNRQRRTNLHGFVNPVKDTVMGQKKLEQTEQIARKILAPTSKHVLKQVKLGQKRRRIFFQ